MILLILGIFRGLCIMSLGFKIKVEDLVVGHSWRVLQQGRRLLEQGQPRVLQVDVLRRLGVRGDAGIRLLPLRRRVSSVSIMLS